MVSVRDVHGLKNAGPAWAKVLARPETNHSPARPTV